jgi:hypothetical protein
MVGSGPVLTGVNTGDKARIFTGVNTRHLNLGEAKFE